MGIRTLTAKTTLALVALDVVFFPLVTSWYLDIIGIGMVRAAVIITTLVAIVKTAACVGYTRSQLRPYEICLVTRDSERSPEMILRADAKMQGFVSRVGVFYAFSWALTYAVASLILRSTIGHESAVNSAYWETTAIAFIGTWCGGFCAGTPLVTLLTDSAAGDCSIIARKHGITLPRSPESLQNRIALIAFALALGPTACFMAVGYTKQVEAQERQNQLQAAQYAARLSESYQAQASPEEARKLLTSIRGGTKGVELMLVDHQGRSLVPDSDGELRVTPDGLQAAERAKKVPADVIRFFGRSERIGYQRVEDHVTAVARVDIPGSSGGYILGAILLALVIALWAPTCAFLLARAITGPIERLIRTTERIVEEGKQSEMAALPVIRNDEVGRLSARFNDLLDMMRDLSHGADSIAKGELRVEISRKGELPDAFRRMLESLRGMVREIRGTSVDLASAATEILAASQEQESAAASQSSAMEEINRTMDSLSTSAAHVSDSVQGVVANAEQTLSTTDKMVARITELSGHANRIGEILDVIREIADRSDLLALNGSLEASRAGESGHGFALVATEMRRLAERVTASVEDVKKLVSDIRDSGSSTVAATEESRRLADATTEAARQITFVTQQQRSGTEQVSESIRNITDVVTQAVSATAQTRTSAQGLKSQADRLAALVKRFELESSGAT